MDLFGYFYWLTIQRSTSKLSIIRWNYSYMYSFNMLLKSFSVVSHFIAVFTLHRNCGHSLQVIAPAGKILSSEFSFTGIFIFKHMIIIICRGLACRHGWWWWWAHHSVPGYGDGADHIVRGGCGAHRNADHSFCFHFKIWGLWLFKMEILISVKHRKWQIWVLLISEKY